MATSFSGYVCLPQFSAARDGDAIICKYHRKRAPQFAHALLSFTSMSNDGHRIRQRAEYNFLFVMIPNNQSDVAHAIDALYRADWGRIVAALIKLVGDFDIAEEAAQEAFAAAINQWQATGIPEFPRAWIIQ